MLDRVWRFLRRRLVEDVPDDLAACMDCGVLQCGGDKWRNCPNRLARLALLEEMRGRVDSTSVAGERA